MKPIAMLVMPVVLLAAAGTTSPVSGSRAPVPAQSDGHMNRHVDAHLPVRDGEATNSSEEPVRRRPAQDPFRGVVRPHTPSTPTPAQPLRDRRY